MEDVDVDRRIKLIRKFKFKLWWSELHATVWVRHRETLFKLRVAYKSRNCLTA